MRLNEYQNHSDVRRQIARWRARAEQLRTIADEFTIPSAQDALGRTAANYEALADDAEARLARSARSAKSASH